MSMVVAPDIVAKVSVVKYPAPSPSLFFLPGFYIVVRPVGIAEINFSHKIIHEILHVHHITHIVVNGILSYVIVSNIICKFFEFSIAVHFSRFYKYYFIFFVSVIRINIIVIGTFAKVLYTIINTVHKAYSWFIGHIIEIHTFHYERLHKPIAHHRVVEVVSRVSQHYAAEFHVGLGRCKNIIAQHIFAKLVSRIYFQRLLFVHACPASGNLNVELLIESHGKCGIVQFKVGRAPPVLIPVGGCVHSVACNAVCSFHINAYCVVGQILLFGDDRYYRQFEISFVHKISSRNNIAGQFSCRKGAGAKNTCITDSNYISGSVSAAFPRRLFAVATIINSVAGCRIFERHIFCSGVKSCGKFVNRNCTLLCCISFVVVGQSGAELFKKYPVGSSIVFSSVRNVTILCGINHAVEYLSRCI